MRRGKEMNWKIGDELDQVCQTTLPTETQHKYSTHKALLEWPGSAAAFPLANSHSLY